MLEQITTTDEIPTATWYIDEELPIHNWSIEFGSLDIQMTSVTADAWEVRFYDYALNAWLYGDAESVKAQVLERLKGHVKTIQGYIEAMESA